MVWVSASSTSTMAIGYNADSTGTETLMIALSPALETMKLNTVKMTCHVR